jgi:uncharacterized SAM-binding protein YcdF (DUF218 family)
VLSILKWIDAPGSIQVLAIALAIAALLAFVWPRRRAVTLSWILSVSGVYTVLALPVTAAAISGALPAVEPPPERSARRLDSIIVFDGDNRRGRVRRAAELFAEAPSAEIWSLGWQPWMETALAEAGIPSGRIRHVSETANTRDQIDWTEEFLRRHSPEAVTIVASRLQMPRISKLLRARGLRPQLAPSPADWEPESRGLAAVRPTYYALRISRDALYEHMALWYYRRNGWIR